MQHTEKKIKLIRDKLSRIGIREKDLDDETILTSYSINSCGNLCSIKARVGEPSGADADTSLL